MKYMVIAYGYEAGNTRTNIETIQGAEKILRRKVKKWCKENDVNIDDTDYTEGDYFFSYGIEYRGICIYEIIEVPDFNNKIEELIWKAKLETQFADYAADDYAYSLEDNCVSCHTCNARDLLDKALELMNGR